MKGRNDSAVNPSEPNSLSPTPVLPFAPRTGLCRCKHCTLTSLIHRAEVSGSLQRRLLRIPEPLSFSHVLSPPGSFQRPQSLTVILFHKTWELVRKGCGMRGARRFEPSRWFKMPSESLSVKPVSEHKTKPRTKLHVVNESRGGRGKWEYTSAHVPCRKRPCQLCRGRS